MFDWQTEAAHLAARFGEKRLREAVAVLSEAYRAGRPTRAPGLDEELLTAAYLAVRFPATLAANRFVASQIHQALQHRHQASFAPASLLDLGAGTGAATIAALEHWPELSLLSAFEPLAGLSDIGKQLLPRAIWRAARFDAAEALPAHDIVWASYSFGELQRWQETLDKAWTATTRLLVVVEPGTSRGFAQIKAMRQWLIIQGAAILAPCPSQAPCPVPDGDWCHFSARLNRSSLHRRLKDGSLGYEDEKFSWLAAWRGPLPIGQPRILRHPLIEAGCITLRLCAAPEIQSIQVTKKDKSSFRMARKSAWGETWPVDLPGGARLSKSDE